MGKGDHSGTGKRAMHMKRYDPRNPLSAALIVGKKEDYNSSTKPLTPVETEQAKRKQMHEEGRL